MNKEFCYLSDDQGLFTYQGVVFSLTDDFLLPAHASWEAPVGELREGFIERLNPDTLEWSYVSDHRGKTQYNAISGISSIVDYPGDIRVGYTLATPPVNHRYYSYIGGVWIPEESKKTELIQELSARINTETDKKIIEGFIYQEKEFYLSLENQFNYKSTYDARARLSYPFTVKGKSEFVSFADSAELESFYLAGFEYVSNCIAEGWQAKEILKTKTTQELLEDLCGQL